MKVLSKQNNSKMCVICGLENEFGVKAPFYNMEDGSVITIFKYKKEHQSYPGRVHGGLICTMIDELIGRTLWVNEPDQYGVTMSINVKYRKVVPYDVTLKGVGVMTKESDKFFEGEAKIYDANTQELLAEGTAHYYKMPLNSIGSINEKDINVYVPDEVKEIK
jgi:uncharacterized protein (TIGR00369 family)